MADVRGERERMESELHRSSADEKIVFGKKSFSKYVEISVAETLRSSGGDIGGGSENLVLHGIKRVRYVRQIASGFSNNK
jgi:hypothetical protein